MRPREEDSNSGSCLTTFRAKRKSRETQSWRKVAKVVAPHLRLLLSVRVYDASHLDHLVATPQDNPLQFCAVTVSEQNTVTVQPTRARPHSSRSTSIRRPTPSNAWAHDRIATVGSWYLVNRSPTRARGGELGIYQLWWDFVHTQMLSCVLDTLEHDALNLCKRVVSRCKLGEGGRNH